MNGLFQNCKKLETIPDISKWDTENLENIEDLFFGYNNFTWIFITNNNSILFFRIKACWSINDNFHSYFFIFRSIHFLRSTYLLYHSIIFCWIKTINKILSISFPIGTNLEINFNIVVNLQEIPGFIIKVFKSDIRLQISKI